MNTLNSFRIGETSHLHLHLHLHLSAKNTSQYLQLIYSSTFLHVSNSYLFDSREHVGLLSTLSV